MSNLNHEALKQLCQELMELDGTVNDALIAKIEALYEQALTIKILSERNQKIDTLQQRVLQRVQQAPKPVQKIEEAKEQLARLGDEVKVLPHPEGPPKPTPRPEADIPAATPKPTPAPAPAPKPAQPEPPVAKEEPAQEPTPAPAPKATIEPPREVKEALEHRPLTDAKPTSSGSLKNMNIGLNDRIAFVKQLFMGSQEDYNRVVSQINTMDDYNETIAFIENVVKPDYDWSEVEETENRLLELVANRFN